MGIGVEIVGKQSLGNWLFGSSDKDFATLDEWFTNNTIARLSRTWRGNSYDGNPALFLLVYPVAEPIMVSQLGLGRYRIEAKTSTLGPAYHFHICDLIKKAGNILKLRWKTSSEYALETDLDPARQSVYDAMNQYLSAVAEQILEIGNENLSEIQIGLPAGEVFLTRALVNTANGPRDKEWLVRAAKNAPACSDIFPLFYDAPGKYELGLAQALMWTNVRWHRPWNAEQFETLTATAELLERSHDLDPNLNFPWREWQELLALLESDWVSPKRAEVERQARIAAQDVALIGYRREAVRRQLSGGWSICVPGSFDAEYEDGTLYLADLERSVRITGFDISKEGKLAAPETILESQKWENSENRLTFTKERVAGAGSFVTDEEGQELFFSCVAARGELQMCTFRFKSPEYRDWAVRTWRSMDKAPED